MITIYPVSKDVKKFCTHCDKPAKFDIDACNPSIIQQSITMCLCQKCMTRLKSEVNKITPPQQTRKSLNRSPANELLNCSNVPQPKLYYFIW